MLEPSAACSMPLRASLLCSPSVTALPCTKRLIDSSKPIWTANAQSEPQSCCGPESNEGVLGGLRVGGLTGGRLELRSGFDEA